MTKKTFYTTANALIIILLWLAAPISAQNISYEVIRINNGNPIIESSMFANPNDGLNINGPSLIRIPDWIPISDRADASAQYYLYFAHHLGDYIRMAWAENIEGPYTLYDNYTTPGDRGVLDNNESDIYLDNNIRIKQNHLASPDVMVDHVNQRIIMYFHSGASFYVNDVKYQSQVTWVATSSDGLEFYDGIESVHLGRFYFRVFEYDGGLYALDNGAQINRALDYANPWAVPTGHDFSQPLWELHPDHVFQNDIPLPADELLIRHTAVRVVGDELHTFYSRTGEFQERIMLSTMNMSGDWTQWDPSYPPIEVLAPNPGWEGGDIELNFSMSGGGVNVNQVRDPDVFEDTDGQLYLLYSGRGEGGIGIAKLYESPTIDTTLITTADAHIKESNLTKNFGLLTNTRVSKGASSSSKRTMYMKFDLSEIDDLEHAVVRLYVNETSGGPVTIYETSEVWEEGLITAGNAPPLGNAITTTYLSNDAQYYDWNISEYAKANAGSILSVAFNIAPQNDASHKFGSLQSSNPAQMLLAGVDNQNNCTPGQICDDNDNCTIEDVFNANCNCIGIFQDSDGDGICDANDICSGYDDTIDSDGNGIPDGCDNCPAVGEPCDDNDPCTANSLYSDCLCQGVTNFALAGFPSMSSQYNETLNATNLNDGVISNENSELAHTANGNPHDWVEIDLGQTENIAAIVIWNRTNCCSNRLSNAYLLVSDTPFPSNTDLNASLTNADYSYQFGNTTNQEMIGIDIAIPGRYVRIQKSGSSLPINLKEIKIFGLDDGSDCGEGCTTFNYNDFESSLGIWNDGGGDASRNSYPSYSDSGDGAVRLRDNSGVASSIYTDPLDFNNVSSLEVSFSFWPTLMENNEDFFLEVSSDNGSSFTIIESYVTGIDFVNDQRYYVLETIPGTYLSSNTVIRFRCDASGNPDYIYLDDVVISTCQSNALEIEENVIGKQITKEQLTTTRVRDESSNTLTLFPNPATSLLNIKLLSDDIIISAEIFDLNGRNIKRIYNVETKLLEVDVSNLINSRVYLFKVLTNKGHYYAKKFIKK